MNQKEIIEELKENMPKFNGNQEEVEIKTALYLYIELAKKKTFDERYYWGNQKIRNLAYKESVQDSKSTDKMIKKRKITCVSISHLYKYVLEQFGIQCDVVKEDPEDPHLNNVIKLKSGKKLNVDIQMDMYRIQTGMTLKHFTSKTGHNITKKELDNMLKKIGYISDEADYTDNKIKILKNEIENVQINEALEIIMNSRKINSKLNQAGMSETYKYYKAVFRILLHEKLGKEIFQFQVKSKKNENNDYKYSFCIYSKDPKTQEKKVYLYSEKNKRMLECDLETLGNLQKDGLTFGRTGREEGVKILEKTLYKMEKEKKEEEK